MREVGGTGWEKGEEDPWCFGGRGEGRTLPFWGVAQMWLFLLMVSWIQAVNSQTRV